MQKGLVTVTNLFLFSVITASEALKNINCSLQPTVLSTKVHSYPYYVSLTRCKGSAYATFSTKERNHRCVAATKNMIHLVVKNIMTRKTEIINIANHTSCISECALTTSDCSKPAFLRNCECKCPYRYMKCGPNKRWSKSKCRCECIETSRKCPIRREFNEKTCQCKCKQHRIEKCLNRGRQFNYESCKCSNRKHSASRGGGKIAGSNTLWICAAVGEFVILCIVIELILYYKGHGLMYKVSERLKTHNSFKQVANSDNGKQCQNARITDEEDQYVYF